MRRRAKNPIPHLRFGKYVRFAWGSPELTEWLQKRSSVCCAGRRASCELAGLVWENFDAKKGSMRITQSVWEGHVTRPKTKKSKAPVPIIKTLVRMLEAHRVRTAQTKERAAPIPNAGPIFASEAGTALNMNNLLNRQILPALNQCQHCHKPEDDHGGTDHKYMRDESLPSWHGWHGFRRGLGTNLKRLGVDLKTIQEILRHAHIATTADIYVKEISEQAVEAKDRL